MHRLLMVTAFCVGASLMTPAAMRAGDKRYYDRGAPRLSLPRTAQEEIAGYRVYLGEQHREYREFGKTKVI